MDSEKYHHDQVHSIAIIFIVTVFDAGTQPMGMKRETIAVTGMSCNGCEQTVESALANIEGVSRVDANNEAETVEVVVDDDVADEDITAVIEQAGFDVAT